MKLLNNLNFKTNNHVFIDEKLKEWSKSSEAGSLAYLFDDGNTENIKYVEKIFKKTITEIKLTEGKY